MRLLTMFIAAASATCFGDALGAPDANCNPTLDPPVAAGGCTWYNFYATYNADGSQTISAGSSYGGYYSMATNPPWTITTAGYTTVRIVDGGHQGDTFSLYDNGAYIGSTSATPIDLNHVCANDTGGAGAGGTDPAECWNDKPNMSQGSFLIPPGSHSFTVTWDQRVGGNVPGNTSYLQWFEIGTATAFSSFTVYPMSINHSNFMVSGTFTPATGMPAFSPSQTVSLQVGAFQLVIPPGSFQGSYSYTFNGVINGIPIYATISPYSGRTYYFKITGTAGMNPFPTSNPTNVSLTVGSSVGSTSQNFY